MMNNLRIRIKNHYYNISPYTILFINILSLKRISFYLNKTDSI